jgi:hypothetical protein
VSKGVRKFALEHNHVPPAYAVQTKFVLRKYSLRILQALFTPIPEGYATLPVTGAPASPPPQPPADGDRYGDKALLVTDWPRYLKGRAAFKQHASQYSWDRVLYLVLSRYMWFNDLRRM